MLTIYGPDAPNPAGKGANYATAFDPAANKLAKLAGPFKNAGDANKALKKVKALAVGTGKAYTAFGTAFFPGHAPRPIQAGGVNCDETVTRF